MIGSQVGGFACASKGEGHLARWWQTACSWTGQPNLQLQFRMEGSCIARLSA